MRIQVFQHVPFEGIGSMAQDFAHLNWAVTTTHWYRGDAPPRISSYDALIIIGGPMGIHDEAEYPWLVHEKEAIRAAIAADKIVLGICLGAQLIASVLGADVRRNPYPEIGWLPLQLTADGRASLLGDALPDGELVFQWHGDTFALPEGARWLASSTACAHQAFAVGNKIWGFQFHLEATEELARALIRECGIPVAAGEFVQTAEQILSDGKRFGANNRMMSQVLERIFSLPA